MELLDGRWAALLRCIVGGVHIALIGSQRHLRIDHNVTVVGEMQDEVGYQALAVVAFQPLADFVLQGLLCVPW